MDEFVENAYDLMNCESMWCCGQSMALEDVLAAADEKRERDAIARGYAMEDLP